MKFKLVKVDDTAHVVVNEENYFSTDNYTPMDGVVITIKESLKNINKGKTKRFPHK